MEQTSQGQNQEQDPGQTKKWPDLQYDSKEYAHDFGELGDAELWRLAEIVEKEFKAAKKDAAVTHETVYSCMIDAGGCKMDSYVSIFCRFRGAAWSLWQKRYSIWAASRMCALLSWPGWTMRRAA